MQKISRLFFQKKSLILFILLLSIFIRFWRLGVPNTYYFDEVYHAYTAKEMLVGNPAAWEFWHTPPGGFAYEWSHPPLAKLFMSLGMIIFGANAFGWRFFGAAAGVGIVLLVYILSMKLFKDKFIACTSSFLIVFESLVFVQSRIGMNDVYFIFFMLLSLILLLSRRYFLMGIFWGLALASKWTAVYGIFIFPIFFLHELYSKQLQNKKAYIRKIFLISPFCFLIVPVLIYLFSYSPYFFLNDPTIKDHIDANSGVGKIERDLCLKAFDRDFCDKLTIVWNVQQQIYWYHTRLKATHSYQSLWNTWPFDIRPVYYYVENFDGKIAQIYAMGNPAIFWAGILAVIYSFYKLLSKPSFNLGFVIACYLAFWLPWALSPRIMFIYHYTPSVVFLAILIAIGLRDLWERENLRFLVFIYLAIVGATFIYFYPHTAAWPVPKSLNDSYFWLNSWH